MNLRQPDATSAARACGGAGADLGEVASVEIETMNEAECELGKMHAGIFGFARPALLAIHRYSRGVPRRIDRICDRAALLAFARSCRRVDLPMVHRASSEVQGRDAGASGTCEKACRLP